MKKTLVSLIAVCALVAVLGTSVFATSGSINSVSQNFELYSNNGTLTLQVQASACSPYDISTFGVPASFNGTITGNTSSTATIQSGSIYSDYTHVVQQDFIYMFRLANNTNEDLFINTGYLSALISTAENATSNPDPDWWGCYYEILGGNLFDTITSVSTGGTVQYRWSSPFTYNSGLVIPAKSVLYSQVVQHLIMTMQNPLPTLSNPFLPDKFARKINTITVGNPTSSQVAPITNFTLMNADYNSIEEIGLLTTIHNDLVSLISNNHTDLTNIKVDITLLYTRNHNDLLQIHNDLQSIIDSYTANSSNATNVVNDASSTTSTIDEVHRQEEEFYLMNQSALQEVGLNNYDIDPNTRLGYTAINSDFDKLWRSLGPWVGVYTFTLLISLASYIIRLKPWTTNHTHKDN